MGRHKKKKPYSLYNHGPIIIPLSFLIGGGLYTVATYLDKNSFPFFSLLSLILLFILVIYSTFILKDKKISFFVELLGNISIAIASIVFLIPWLRNFGLESYLGFVLVGIYMLLKYFIYDQLVKYWSNK